MIFTKILPQILKNGLTHQIMMKEEDKTIPLPTEKKKKKKKSNWFDKRWDRM